MIKNRQLVSKCTNKQLLLKHHTKFGLSTKTCAQIFIISHTQTNTASYTQHGNEDTFISSSSHCTSTRVFI